MIRHYFQGRQGPAEEWDPRNPAPHLPWDCVYFGKALVEMERHLGNEDLRCYLTWLPDELPEYGPDVIAILVGEEWGLIPRYARHVRLTARVMSRSPFLGIRKWLPLSRLKLMLAFKHLRNWILHLRSWLRYKFPPSSWPVPVHRSANIVHIPWGSASLVEVPIKPMRERTRNYYFSGGTAFSANFGYRRFMSSPKQATRESLVEAVAEMERKHPELTADQAIQVHAHMWTGHMSDMEQYAQRLMNSKICLAPRGSVADTWRFFEGLKSGCVVITNPLPDEWYYQGAPAIQLDEWGELEQTVVPLLKDEPRLEELHALALKYWDEVCGEKSLGRFLAKGIQESPAPK